MRVTGTPNVTVHTLLERAEEANSRTDPITELETLSKLQLPATIEEMLDFTLYPWNFSSLQDYQSFRASVPKTWR